jgi:hypothetical protein
MNDKYTPPTIVGDESDSKLPSRNRRAILKLLIGVCLAIASLLYAVEIMNGGIKNPEATKEGDKMFLTKTESEPNRTIPPVDANTPVRIETATFALG